MNKYNSPKSTRHRNVKMYADLIGNYKKQKIKNFYDNKRDCEFGTGLFAEAGDGRKDVPWHYQDAKGEWHSTSGQHPQPFLRPALTDNEEKIKSIIINELKQEVKTNV